jgi:hypothetical protein
LAILEDDQMPRKVHTPEEIIAKLRQVEMLMTQGKSTADAVRVWGRVPCGANAEWMFLCSVGAPFLRPSLHYNTTARGAAVKTGRGPPPEAARSGIDGCEHGATLNQVGASRRVIVRSAVRWQPQPQASQSF